MNFGKNSKPWIINDKKDNQCVLNMRFYGIIKIKAKNISLYLSFFIEKSVEWKISEEYYETKIFLKWRHLLLIT